MYGKTLILQSMRLSNNALILLVLKRPSNLICAHLSVFVVCRRGNDSQRGVMALRESLSGLHVSVRDIIGGLHSWAEDVDPSFPVY